MPFVVTIDLSDVKRALARGQRAIERGTSDAVIDMAELAAEEARQNHPYTDRTDNLTGAIDASRGYDGPYGAIVTASIGYASYVEGGTKNRDGSQRSKPYPFLQPAVDLRTGQAACDFAFEVVANAVNAAINK